MSNESHYQQLLLLAAPARFPDVRFFRRNTGKFTVKGFGDAPDRTMRFAIPGQCDLYCIMRSGRIFEVELKNVGKKLEPDQIRWKAWCDEWRVPHAVLTVHKNETEQQTIDRWCNELTLLFSQGGSR